jgi:hypothetical protein
MRTRRIRLRWVASVWVLFGVVAVACGDSDETTTGWGSGGSDAGGSGPADARQDDWIGTSGTGGVIVGDAGPDTAVACSDGGCPAGTVCKYGFCLPNLGTCQSNDDCPGDSYCDTDQTCVPYGYPPSKVNDPTCQKAKQPPGVAPTVQCEWSGTEATDPTKDFFVSYSAPMIADLNLDLDAKKLQPSIVITTWKTESLTLADGGTASERFGMLRVFDGRDCKEQMHIGGPDDPEVELNRPAYGSQWVLVDLDGDVGSKPDGHPEIVGFHRSSGPVGSDPPAQLIAYGIDTSGAKPKLVRRWIGRTCGTDDSGAEPPVSILTNWSTWPTGPGAWDLDDDGVPEIVIDKQVFDSRGCLLNPSDGNVEGFYTAVADVDLDGVPDLVRHDGVYGWQTTTRSWARKAWSQSDAAVHLPGYVAIVDVGRYSAIPGHAATEPLPEIVVVGGGTIRVQTLGGEVLFGPMALYNQTPGKTPLGGAPTASDFDGDGYVEFAAAGGDFYAVYDPDCAAGGVPAARPGAQCLKTDASLPSGILWARPSQDWSSSTTGSSVFDFDGDGASEVVYGDECYLRVYKGATGEVIFSAPASSGTGSELPVIADVDGDFATEIVASRASMAACPATDPLFPAGEPFEAKGGFVVLRDPQDRWVSSRPVWNQHAYSITHVTDDARVVKSSEMLRNWEQKGMNNFRQNTQGELGKLALADLTVELGNLDQVCSGETVSLSLVARVCNRGTNPVQDGAGVAFYMQPNGTDAGADAGQRTLLCETQTDTLLAPGECTVVQCTGTLQAGYDVFVVVDPDGKVADCHPGNNAGASSRVLCPRVR